MDISYNWNPKQTPANGILKKRSFEDSSEHFPKKKKSLHFAEDKKLREIHEIGNRSLIYTKLIYLYKENVQEKKEILEDLSSVQASVQENGFYETKRFKEPEYEDYFEQFEETIKENPEDMALSFDAWCEDQIMTLSDEIDELEESPTLFGKEIFLGKHFQKDMFRYLSFYLEMAKNQDLSEEERDYKKKIQMDIQESKKAENKQILYLKKYKKFFQEIVLIIWKKTKEISKKKTNNDQKREELMKFIVCQKEKLMKENPENEQEQEILQKMEEILEKAELTFFPKIQKFLSRYGQNQVNRLIKAVSKEILWEEFSSKLALPSFVERMLSIIVDNETYLLED